MLITREDRWRDILDKLRYGMDRGIERTSVRKNDRYVTIEGRRMSVREAYRITGISPTFFDDYVNKEVPTSFIVERLDAAWMRKKARMLKQETLLK